MSTDYAYSTDWGRDLFFCVRGSHGLHGLGQGPLFLFQRITRIPRIEVETFCFLFPRITRITRIGAGALVFVSTDHTDYTDWGRVLCFVSTDHTYRTD